MIVVTLIFILAGEQSCSEGLWCDEGKCVPGVLQCDGHVDCLGHKDEAPELCGLSAFTSLIPLLKLNLIYCIHNKRFSYAILIPPNL